MLRLALGKRLSTVFFALQAVLKWHYEPWDSIHSKRFAGWSSEHNITLDQFTIRIIFIDNFIFQSLSKHLSTISSTVRQRDKKRRILQIIENKVWSMAEGKQKGDSLLKRVPWKPRLWVDHRYQVLCTWFHFPYASFPMCTNHINGLGLDKPKALSSSIDDQWVKAKKILP